MEKISVYTILYYDLQFYEDIIKYLYDFVDEFIIIDGPYSYAVDIIKKFNLFYDESNKPNELNEIIKKYPKIKYKYVICDTEEEKRMIGYNMCSNNLVLLVDTDEFLIFDIDKFNRFNNNPNKFVCCSKIYNMCDYNVNFNNLTEKYIMFKKTKISALEHLDYTWLVGCKQNKKNMSYMCFDAFGLIYHYTLNRNIKNNIVKFIFYVLLYRNINNQPFQLFDVYDNDYLFDSFTPNEIINIFIHASPQSINIPKDKDTSNLQIIEENSVLEYLKKYEYNNFDFYFKTEMRCLLNIPVCFRVEPKKMYVLIFENVMDICLNINYLYINSNAIKKAYNYTNLSTGVIEISNEIDDNAKYTYIELKCNKTIDANAIFILKHIL